MSIFKKLFSNQKELSGTEVWFQAGGKELIRKKVEQYRGRGIGEVLISNFDILPWEVEKKELAPMIKTCPCKYITIPEYPGQDDIILYVDAKGGVCHE